MDDSGHSRLIEAAISLPVRGLYAYRLGSECSNASLGCRILVPFGARRVTAYLMGFIDRAPEGVRIREVISCLDPSPSLSEEILDLCTWIAEYYQYPIGEVIRTALPPGINVASERKAYLTEKGRFFLKAGREGIKPDESATKKKRALPAGLEASALKDDAAGLNKGDINSYAGSAAASEKSSSENLQGNDVPNQDDPLFSEELPSDDDLRVLAEIQKKGSAGCRVGGRGKTLSGKLAARLYRKGLISIESEMASARVGEKKTLCFKPAFSPDEIDSKLALLKKAPVQSAMLKWIAARERVFQEELNKAFPCSYSSLKSLLSRGMVIREEIGTSRSPKSNDASDILAGDISIPELTEDQEKVLSVIASKAGKGFSPFLLQGVTGSGKTEVYLRVIEEVLERGFGALVLVPEISLTPQLAGRFRARFGESVAVLHSGLSEGERHDEWWRIQKGEARVAVGVRSAIFAPVKNPGVIIVDEEHDTSFKQEEGLRYHARDIALVRGRKTGSLVILGSATPSMESCENVLSGRYEHLRLPCRVGGREMPSMISIDLRREVRFRKRVNSRDKKGESALFFMNEDSEGSSEKSRLLSEKLVEALRETKALGKQAILFLNRRGHTQSLVCEDCGESLRCRSCDVSLTLHRRPLKMICHYCGFTAKPSPKCPGCGGVMLPIGVGTQQIEDEVRYRIPNARITRLDRDSVARKGSLAELLSDFALGRSDILVGTQMVAKGHDFPGVTVVGVIQADAGLAIPDFRASERTFQLLMQVSGRAGRGNDQGTVYVQSRRPEHPALSLALLSDFDGFASMELEFRRKFRWPPFCRLLMVRIEGNVAASVEESANRLTYRIETAAIAHPEADIEVLGPAPAPISRLKEKIRWQLLIKAPSPAIIRWAVNILNATEIPKGVDMFPDIDPVGMM